MTLAEKILAKLSDNRPRTTSDISHQCAINRQEAQLQLTRLVQADQLTATHAGNATTIYQLKEPTT